MEKEIFTDNDMYFAMLKSVNEDLRIDPFYVAAIENHSEPEETMEWFGMIYNYNGMDVKNIKHPFFQS